MRVTIGRYLKVEAKSIGMSERHVEEMKTHFEQKNDDFWGEDGKVKYKFKGLKLEVSYDRLVNHIELNHIYDV